MDPLDALGGVIETGLDPRRLAAAAVRAIPRRDRSVVGDPVLNETASRALLDPEELARILSAPRQAKDRSDAIARALARGSGQLLPPTLAADRQQPTTSGR
jgi:hypothetical protein